MKKTLIASAIAAATFSGSVLAQGSNLPTIYGNIQYAIAYDDVKDGGNDTNHYDNGSTIGIKHAHAITPGLEGFFKAEFHFDADDNNGNNDGIYEIDEAYIGVRGENFGQLWIGKDDDTYERSVSIIAEYFEAANLSHGLAYTTGEGDLVQYMSPSFGGLSIWGAVQYNGDSDDKGGSKSFPWQLAAVYTMGDLELAAAIDSNDNTGLDANNENSYGFRATYALDNLALTGEYHTRKDVEDTYGIMGVYTLGKNRFALAYERTEQDFGDDLDYDTITVQALHNVSDNLYVYIEGYFGGGDDVYDTVNLSRVDQGGFDGANALSDERTIAVVGATYYF